MKNRHLIFVFAVVLAAACSQKTQEVSQAEMSQPAEAAQQAAAPADTQQNKEINANMEALKNPASLTEKAPETFKVKFTTTKGDFTLEVTRAWSPLGADRFYNLVKAGFFSDVAFFRVISGFMVQFGIHGEPEVAAAWRGARIQDDPVKQSNAKGYISYAMAGPNTRTTQFFINYGNNANLDSMGFSPFGKVTEGMNVVESIYSGYGEGAPSGMGPDQGRVQLQGNKYLKAEFPKMDYVKSAELLK
ncbi:MAG TPA: peptidylprolyl isomerase [Elusimicrobiales bacterium]|nr:peptidylprolyl isomerase [Elusimicrobiales bacterium]